MEKINIGMYVRTNNGIIGKIYEKIGDMFTYKDSNRNYITYDLLHSEITKASYNIIDILEVGDYVNGSKVQEIRKNYIEIEEYSGLNNDEPCILKSEDIQSILTHEQMEKMAYIIEKGDDK